MFVLGCDSDTLETIRTTVDFAIENEIDTVQFLTIIPFPGTEFYDQMDAEDRIITYDWELFDGHRVVIEPKNMTPYELQMASFQAMLRFYAPRRAFKLLTRNIRHELPFLIDLFFRERKIRIAIPKVALMALIPKLRLKIPTVLQKAIDDSRKWMRLRSVFIIPMFRQYAYHHTKAGLHLLENQKHIAWLRTQTRPRQRSSEMA
jgi:radical SAM superfamily enzyme YgiQ (UPF0313 family)